MSLVTNITNLTLAVADELNKRPIPIESIDPPPVTRDKQFWRRKTDNALFQYSSVSGQYEMISAGLAPQQIVDGGNF